MIQNKEKENIIKELFERGEGDGTSDYNGYYDDESLIGKILKNNPTIELEYQDEGILDFFVKGINGTFTLYGDEEEHGIIYNGGTK